MLYFMILAGGKGSRMHSPELPKQFIKIGDEPIIVRTIKNFTDFGTFEAGVVCCPVDWLEYTKALLLEYKLASANISVIPGGANRNSSVKNACRFLAERYTLTDNDIVLTHDAVRPFINSRIIRENIAAVNEYGAANTVMPIFDSVIRSFDGEFISDALSRKNIYRVQTPQSFKALQLNTVINSLSQEELEKFTDVASVFSERGFRVKLVTGDDSNIKITTPFDLAVAEAVLQNLP